VAYTPVKDDNAGGDYGELRHSKFNHFQYDDDAGETTEKTPLEDLPNLNENLL